MSGTLPQLIAQGNRESEHSIALWKDTCRLVADRLRLHDDFHAMLAASDVSLMQASAWFWQHCKTGTNAWTRRPEAEPVVVSNPRMIPVRQTSEKETGERITTT
jgi:hypothetical protein